MDKLEHQYISALIHDFNDNDDIWEENSSDKEENIIKNAQNDQYIIQILNNPLFLIKKAQNIYIFFFIHSCSI